MLGTQYESVCSLTQPHILALAVQSYLSLVWV